MASQIILNPGGGKKVLFLGNEMVLKIVSRDTGGVFSLCEFTMRAGFGGPPPHIHQEHEETFYVLEGQLRFRIDGREIEAPAGALAHVAHTSGILGSNPRRCWPSSLPHVTRATSRTYREPFPPASRLTSPASPRSWLDMTPFLLARRLAWSKCGPFRRRGERNSVPSPTGSTAAVPAHGFA